MIFQPTIMELRLSAFFSKLNNTGFKPDLFTLKLGIRGNCIDLASAAALPGYKTDWCPTEPDNRARMVTEALGEMGRCFESMRTDEGEATRKVDRVELSWISIHDKFYAFNPKGRQAYGTKMYELLGTEKSIVEYKIT
ncbi:hypothetical protein V6N13_059299 [Hibiscus sabdariffa]|uniref:Uncharacterized protein n=1 Tax=Hibiscus sabdariffa TaxID=183260 RepID=A0ABR2GEN1_9ROSI